MSRNVQQQHCATRFADSTAGNINAEIDKLCEDFKNMHINHCSSEDRHSANGQVRSSRPKQICFRGNYQVPIESAHCSHATAQPKFQTQSIQEPMIDMSKHVNVDCQKIVSLEQKVEAQDGPVSNTIRVNKIDTFNQTNIISTVSNRGDIKIDYCPAPVREFTGRQKELEELKKMFEDHQVIAVVGMGGVGKSQLARKYGELYKNTYQYRFWIEADTIEKLDSSFQGLADKLDVKAISNRELMNDIYKAFTKGRALLIFDNVIKPEHVYEYLPTRCQLTDTTVNVLITSIWTDWTTIREVSMVLPPFEAEMSLGLLQILIENEAVQTDEKNWMELANAMGHLPLALRLSSSFIRKQQKYNSKFTIQDYITDFNTRVDKLLTKTTPDYGNDRSIYVTTIMTLESLGKKSKKLVHAAAYFNPENILNSDLVPLIPKAYDLAEALADVINYSLFHDEGTDRFSMHRLIQTSIQLYQQKKKKDETYYSLTLEYTLQNPHSNQYDIVFAYANQYKKIIVQNYKRKKYDRPVILKYLLRNRCTDVLKIIFENFQDEMYKYDAIYLEWGSQCFDMFVFILSCLTSTLHKKHLSYKLFQIACEKDNKSIVQFLLETRLISVTELFKDNQTLLHRAASYASSPIVSLILKLNKEVIDIQDVWGNTALHAVIIQSYSKRSKNSKTVFHVYNENVWDLIELRDNTAFDTGIELCSDISESHIIETARVLIENGASIAIRDEADCTALHYATLYKAVELVSLIIQSDSTVVNIVDMNEHTVLHRLCMHYTVESEHQLTEIARVLIKNGASVVISDRNNLTPLHFAAMNAHAQLVSLLIQTNKEVIDMVDDRGNTALHWATWTYFKEKIHRVEQTISILIENGLSIHTRNIYSRTPMDIISSKYKTLLRRLADEHEKSTRSSNNGTV